MNIRPETPEDYREVEELTREAFWNVYAPGCDFALRLYALEDECIVPVLDHRGCTVSFTAVTEILMRHHCSHLHRMWRRTYMQELPPFGKNTVNFVSLHN